MPAGAAPTSRARTTVDAVGQNETSKRPSVSERSESAMTDRKTIRATRHNGPVPTTTGVITGGGHGIPQTSSAIDLSGADYVEEEFFLSGTATSYVPDDEFGLDGYWSVNSDRTAPFTTRVLVRRPADAAVFSGTCVVEWLNVTSLTDIDVEFGYLAEELMRNGHVWVGVSAQAAGINSDGGSDFGPSAVGLRAWDAQRYQALAHPGDDFSYDIYSQIGRAVVSADGPLGGLAVDVLIAAGESQSAHRMVTYVNAIAPIDGVFDGYFIHSRFGNAAPLSTEHPSAVPDAVRIRDDIDAPVMQVLTETDLLHMATSPETLITHFPPARQPDSAVVCTWEVGGTSHADAEYLRLLTIQGNRQFSEFLDLSAVISMANDGPQKYVVRAAFSGLRRWIIDGTPAPGFGPIEVVDGAIVRDTHGNAVGGVRTPHVDVPIAILSGEGMGHIGRTVPFTTEQLERIYGNAESYRQKFATAVDKAVSDGVFLAADVPEIMDSVSTIEFD